MQRYGAARNRRILCMVNPDDLTIGREDERRVRDVTSNGNVGDGVECEFGSDESGIYWLRTVPDLGLANVAAFIAPDLYDAVKALIAQWLDRDIVSFGSTFHTDWTEKLAIHSGAEVPAVIRESFAGGDLEVLANGSFC